MTGGAQNSTRKDEHTSTHPGIAELLEQTEEEEEELKRMSQTEPGNSSQTNGSGTADYGSDDYSNSQSSDSVELDTDYTSNNEWKPLLEYRFQMIKVRNKQQNMQLRDRIAGTAIALVCIQVFVANVFFLIYLLTNLRETNPNVMIAWLSASVIEVIGILLVVARSLFKPDRKNSTEK